MTTLNIGSQVFPVGVTNKDFAMPAVSISAFTITADCSAWVLPAALSVQLFFSYDNGVTFQHVVGLTQNAPPPWASKLGPSNIMQFGAAYTAPVQPTNVRLTVSVLGNPITIGPSSVTVT